MLMLGLHVKFPTVFTKEVLAKVKSAQDLADFLEEPQTLVNLGVAGRLLFQDGSNAFVTFWYS